jgi:hypothetical protein
MAAGSLVARARKCIQAEEEHFKQFALELNG